MSLLTSHLSINILVLLFPIAFLIHDSEEIFTAENFMRKNREKIRELLPRRLSKMVEQQLSMTTFQFAIAVGVMFIFVITGTYLEFLSLRENQNSALFMVAMIVFFVHSFTHMGQAIIIRNYTPGVLSSVVVVLPYSGYLFYRFFGAGLVDWDAVVSYAPFAMLGLPLVLGAHVFARKMSWLGAGLRAFKK